MQLICPNGHSSTDPDDCSKCGLPMNSSSDIAGQISPVQAASSPVQSEVMVCPECGVERDGPTARFCENCLYNYMEKKPYDGGAVFRGGKAESNLQSSPNPKALESLQGENLVAQPPANFNADILLRWDAVVSVDWERAELQSQKPEDKERVYPLDVEDNLIGRRSDRENIFPEIQIFEDLGTSRRHARIIRKPDGKMVLLDQSSNGTFIDGKRIEANVETPINSDSTITLGLWTKIRLRAH